MNVLTRVGLQQHHVYYDTSKFENLQYSAVIYDALKIKLCYKIPTLDLSVKILPKMLSESLTYYALSVNLLCLLFATIFVAIKLEHLINALLQHFTVK